MEKLELLSAANNKEHLVRHLNSDSLTIGSKAIESTTEEDVAIILTKTDEAYRKEIEEHGNPGRKVFALKTDRWVGTDAVVPAEELQENKVFNIIREPGTSGGVAIKVALIEAKDMPKTNVVHAIYGPYYRSKGKGGIYTMMFGDSAEPFPRDLPKDADARSVAMNERAKEYWNGKNGKGGHVFLVTPQELDVAIKQMDEHGLETDIAKKRLEDFRKNPTSPIISHKPSEKAKDAIDLGNVYLNPVMPMSNFKGKEM